MKKLNYCVEVSFEGMTINTFDGLTKDEAIEKAKEESLNEEYQVFVSWLRASDGQKGYLNRDLDNSITGLAW